MQEAHGEGHEEHGHDGGEVERVSVGVARREVAAGRALLVCAYDDESKCRQLRLENAVSLHDLRRRLGSVPKSQALIFYCA